MYNKILISELKKHNVFNKMVEFINKRIPTHIFRDAYDDEMSLSEHISRLEDSKIQHRSFLTTRISYDGVKLFFIKYFPKFINDKTNGRIKVVEFKNSKIENIESLSFDIIFSIDDIEIPYEIKLTQGKNSWQGATHSSSKVSNYILIMMDIDMGVKVQEGAVFIKKGFMLIDDFKKENWTGVPKDNSSRTALTLPTSRNFNESIIFGKLKKNVKNYSVIMEEIK